MAVSESHSSTLPFAGAAYQAERASSLAGIPVSTLHYWAREGIWAPSVSQHRVKRWSFSDLLALRLIDWLRRDKGAERLPKTSMHKIRRAFSEIEGLGEKLRANLLRVWLDPRGNLVIQTLGETFVPLGRGIRQGVIEPQEIDLIDVWSRYPGVEGPNLLQPRATIRIVPGKLAGEPHVGGTRIPTQMIWGLSKQGLRAREVADLYPGVTAVNVEEAVDLEESLQRNLDRAA